MSTRTYEAPPAVEKAAILVGREARVFPVQPRNEWVLFSIQVNSIYNFRQLVFTQVRVVSGQSGCHLYEQATCIRGFVTVAADGHNRDSVDAFALRLATISSF